MFVTSLYAQATSGVLCPTTCPWHAVYQQMQRWIEAGVFQALTADVQSLLRHFGGRKSQPTAVCIDSRTLQSTPESGARAGYDGAKRRKGSKVHIAVDTLGHLLALKVTADEGDRSQVSALAEEMQQVTGHTVQLAYVARNTETKLLAKRPVSTASGSRWSSTRWPSAASSCCQDGGSSNAPLPGPLASEDWQEITNGSTQPSKASTISPSTYAYTHVQSTRVKGRTDSSEDALLSEHSPGTVLSAVCV